VLGKALESIYQIIHKNDFVNFPLDESILCTKDRDRYHSFKNMAKARDFLLGRHLVKALLEEALQTKIAILDLEYSSLGKPVFRKHKIHFNLSHSGDYIICVVSKNLCGIDIQKVESLTKPDQLWKRIAHPEEIRRFPRLSTESILRTWSQKEAITKCLGGGFSQGFNKIFIDQEGENFFVNQADSRIQIINLRTETGLSGYFVFLALQWEATDEKPPIKQVEALG
jgi:4'-phosphopantetheinyl transferase